MNLNFTEGRWKGVQEDVHYVMQDTAGNRQYAFLSPQCALTWLRENKHYLAAKALSLLLH